MELRAQDELGRYSTVEPTVTAFFTREQLVEQIADLKEKLAKNTATLAMIDEGRVGEVA